MADYSDLGLNSQLQSVDSPLVTQGTESNINYQYDIEAITANKVKTASLNNLQGGTLVLGGTGNGNGLLSIRNQTGTEIVNLNRVGVNIVGSTSPLTFGSSAQADAYYSNTFGLTIENTADGFGTADIRVTTDVGNVILIAGGTARITVGTAYQLIVTKPGGTLMTLNGNTGDLRIAGTIGTGITF